MRVLLSIKPEFVEKIFSGEKKFEYRKAIFTNKDVNKIVVYATMPVGRIVGEFLIEDILTSSPKAIWNKTKEFSGVQYDFFKSYFDGRDKAYAIKIGSPILYAEPIDPKDMNAQFVTPQSFMYWD
ncbi:putative transcriptional regulator [Chitinophaga skermanii]|uniref:Putative transcriptional regulator n=1 Tax=Chitinophaga skermanii TaxID=331697 RepID=A0A327R323_9BACT|nr:ASCH domain-containing protein [Chitinophaga skermanii]RAJ11110.1 putative transcriptional regulator [Chitinophaga skermanii]